MFEKVLKAKITAKGMQISVVSDGSSDDYISLTDIAKYKSEDPAATIQNWMRSRDPTAKYKSFRIDLNNFNNIIESPTPVIEFEKEVIRQHSFLAFQYPDKIADALSYIWNEQNKWDVICSNMATDILSANLKTKLKNIITRRNQIVHEGDCFSANSPLHQQPISILDIDDVNKFIAELANAIDISISM